MYYFFYCNFSLHRAPISIQPSTSSDLDLPQRGMEMASVSQLVGGSLPDCGQAPLLRLGLVLLIPCSSFVESWQVSKRQRYCSKVKGVPFFFDKATHALAAWLHCDPHSHFNLSLSTSKHPWICLMVTELRFTSPFYPIYQHQ